MIVDSRHNIINTILRTLSREAAMVARSIFASHYRLLAGAGIAFLAFWLVGCNEIAAQKADPGRPVLIATVHYAPESPARSFVGTVRPRIETDMGFRVPGKVARRL